MKSTHLLVAGIVLVVAVMAMAGCSSGSPPSQIPVNVTGTVKELGTDTAVQGVVVILQRGNRQYQSDPTDANGEFVIENVLAPATYTVIVQIPDALNKQLAGPVPDLRVEANRNGVQLGTIYLTEKPPGAPGG